MNQSSLVRAAFAAQSAQSRGRLTPENSSPTRSEFQRDRDRIVHSTAFRRLAYKSQVFVPSEGDHYRTRLTHTIEVAQIARALARGLKLDDDLAEAIALAHDLGHTPFGHAGEDALSACMQRFGGFDHNAHALQIVTTLERRYAGFDGLNLSWECLEGLVKHNGPLLDKGGKPTGHYEKSEIPAAILAFDKIFPLELSDYSSAEAQCAAIADDIAYNTHDIDDGLRAGLFDLEDLRQVPFLESVLSEISELHPNLERPRVVHELGRRIITRFVEDALNESARRLRVANPESSAAVRAAGAPLVGFSEKMRAADHAIKGFLFPNMYRHEKVMAVRVKADHVVRSLFGLYMNDTGHMPTEWQPKSDSEAARAHAVADYIAGMTDRFALQDYQRHFDLSYDLG